MKNLSKFHQFKDRLKNIYKRKYPKLKKWMIGTQTDKGIIYKVVMYFLLIVMGFVFIYPLLYMFSISLMSNVDLVDNTIKWIPSSLYKDNYRLTFRALRLPLEVEDFFPRIKDMISQKKITLQLLLPNALYMSIFIAGVSTLSVSIASALVGYGIARYNFKGKKIIITLMIFTYVMPKTLFFIPTYLFYGSIDNFFRALPIPLINDIKFKGTLLPIIVPALLGQGLQASFFILIFYQFFSMIPKSMEEAAVIDGATSFKIFKKIAIPMAIPAFIITFVYGFALYWNETFFLTVYTENNYQTISMLLANLESSYWGAVGETNAGNTGGPNVQFTEAKRFAGTLLSIVPLVFMYAIVQRWFVESIDKSGITGE